MDLPFRLAEVDQEVVEEVDGSGLGFKLLNPNVFSIINGLHPFWISCELSMWE